MDKLITIDTKLPGDMSLLVKTNRKTLAEFKADETVSLIPLGDGSFAIIDKEDEFRITKYKWERKASHNMFYAMRKTTSRNKQYWVRMHRQIMHTPNGQITHHKNRNPLDNRKKNLQNMTELEHDVLHGRTLCPDGSLIA